MGRFGLSLLEAKRLTPADFQIYMKAYSVRQEEDTRRIALQAWMNQTVQAKKKSGKTYRPIYKKFEDFYNSSEQFERIFRQEKNGRENKTTNHGQKLSLADKNRILNSLGKEETNG